MHSTNGGVSKLKQLLQHLEDVQIELENVSLHRATLDDVFFSLTGQTTTKEEQKEEV